MPLTGQLTQQEFIVSRFWRPEVKVSAGPVPSEGCEEDPAPGLSPRLLGDGRLLPVCLHSTFPLYVCLSVRLISPLYKDIGHSGSGSTPMTSLRPDDFYKESISR